MNKYVSLKSHTLSNIDEKIKECEQDAKHYLEDAFTDVNSARDAGEELIRLADLKDCKAIMKGNVSYPAYEKSGKSITFDEFILE